MTLVLPKGLPAISSLKQEGIDVKSLDKPLAKGLPTLHIALLNLMPNKKETEIQIMRLLAVPEINIHVHLVHTASYKSKNTDPEYLKKFYQSYDNLVEEIDGLIITGADVEFIEFEDVLYWEELKAIMNWAEKSIKSTFFICWAAQAGIYHHYGVGKRKMKAKLSGVFPFNIQSTKIPIANNFEKTIDVPHSRYTEICPCSLNSIPDIEVISQSEEYGLDLMISKDGKKVFATGHAEYDVVSLKSEYYRDLHKGLKPSIPANYFPGNNPKDTPEASWRKHGKQLFSNWIQFYVSV